MQIGVFRSKLRKQKDDNCDYAEIWNEVPFGWKMSAPNQLKVCLGLRCLTFTSVVLKKLYNGQVTSQNV